MKEMRESASTRVIPYLLVPKKTKRQRGRARGREGEGKGWGSRPTSQLVKPEGHQLISREALSLSGRDPLISYAHW